MDFDWPKEREKLKQEIIKYFRDKDDRGRHQDLWDNVRFDPSTLTVGSYLEIGPYHFETYFTVAPAMAFGQKPDTNIADKPFLVEPFVSRWTFNAGVVDGFYLGVYALTDVPAGIKNHTVSWRARGKASKYKRNTLTSNWTNPYDNMSPTSIIENKDRSTKSS